MLAIAYHHAHYHFRFQKQSWDSKVMRGQVKVLSLFVGPLNLYELLNLEWCLCYGHIVWRHRDMCLFWCPFLTTVYKPFHIQPNIGVQLRKSDNIIRPAYISYAASNLISRQWASRTPYICCALSTPHKIMAIGLDHQYVSNSKSSRILSFQISETELRCRTYRR